MINKIKKFSKKYLIGFFIGLILFTVVGVSAATYFPSNQTTYNNGTTGMSATNVQEAIDELYNTCFPPKAGDTILDNVDIVTSGDGLYEDEYEDGKYTYKGANPNNYITFNDEKAGWRIVSINSDGTIKIVREASIGNQYWGGNDWSHPTILNTYLNGTYYNGLNSTAQSQIVAKDWSIGGVTDNNTDLAGQINDENSSKWNGKVALITLSEYIRSNSNQNMCGTFIDYNGSSGNCSSRTWMFNNETWWSLTPVASSSRAVFSINMSGPIGANDMGFGVAVARPTVYLSSDIQITGGNGSQSNPYTIE